MLCPIAGAPEKVQTLKEALLHTKYTSGSTHNFYHYPARFPAAIARAVIDAFSEPGDLIIDPFMGGGTTVIEALASGRRVIGSDLNALAHFVAGVRTTPLSRRDEQAILDWALQAAVVFPEKDLAKVKPSNAPNLPRPVEVFMGHALNATESLPLPRQRAFARCVLLRLGQWALDCRDFEAPTRRLLANQLFPLVDEMVKGLRQFVVECASADVRKYEITARRRLLHASCVDLPGKLRAEDRRKPARLIFTSPPYPGVHVLYHRWQFRGRKETSAPYWIADVPDGFGGAYYTAGSRTPTGLRNYFATIKAAFNSLRTVLATDAVVVQLVGFAHVASQLPLYLEVMKQAGYSEVAVPGHKIARLGRRVPNRKWYARLQGAVDASSELLLIHRPS